MTVRYRRRVAELELRHLRYLIAVAETGSITRAAQRLLITQPALSRAIRALERTAGVPLFVRGPQSTELTPAGAALLEEAYEIVARSRAALDRARGARPAAQTLTVAANGCDVIAVAEASRAFEVDHPDVRVNIVPREWKSLSEQLRTGEADVSFLRDNYDTRDVRVGTLAHEPRMVLMHADHPLADQKDLDMSHLRDEPITHWAEMTPEEAAHWAGADLDLRPWRRGPAVGSAADVLAAVLLGRAIAFGHGATLPALSPPGIRVRTADGLSPSHLRIGISAQHATRTAVRFAEHVRERWPSAG